MSFMKLQAGYDRRRERFLLFVTACIASIVSLQILDLGLDKPVLKLTLMAVIIAGFIFGYYLEPRFHRAARIIVDIAGLGFSVYYINRMVQDYTSVGNYLGILAGVLCVLLSFISFDRSMHLQIMLMGIVFVIFAATTSFDLLLVVYIPLFLIFASAGLYFANALNLQDRIAHVGRDEALSPKQATQLMLAVGYLIVRVVAAIIVISTVVYIFVPHYTNINRPAFFLPQVNALDESVDELMSKNEQGDLSLAPGELAISGFSGSFDLANNRSVFGPTSLYFSDDPAIEVRSSQGGYLRGAAFDFYTGQGWEPQPLVKETRRPAHTGHVFTSYAHYYELPVVDFPSQSYASTDLKERGVSTDANNVFSNEDIKPLHYDLYTQEVIFVKDHPPIFFSSYQPVRLEDISVVRTSDGEAFNPRPSLDDFSIAQSVLPRHPTKFAYKLTVLAPDVRRQQMSQSLAPPPEQIVKRYTQLPLETNKAEMERIIGHSVVPVPYSVISKAEALVAGAKTQAEKVQAIYDYLMNPQEFSYNTDIIPLTKTEEATDSFINRTKKGYCQQFASAMVVLCRANKIPARVVTGYGPGSYSIVGNKYVYRDRNAHAWVEVYFDGLGWIVFDPTQGSSDVFSLSRIAEAASSTASFLENLFVVDPDGAKQAIFGFFAGLYNLLKPLALANWRWFPLVALITASFIALVYVLRRARNRRAVIIPQNRIIADYLELSSLLGPSSLARDPSSTSGEFQRKLGGYFDGDKDGLRRFILLYEQAAFSPRPPTSDDVAFADEFVAGARRRFEDSLRREKRK
jgi:transglutaminase-like putative cysteine protease